MKKTARKTPAPAADTKPIHPPKSIAQTRAEDHGTVSGGAAGAALGVAVAGPIGGAIGAVVGAVTGGLNAKPEFSHSTSDGQSGEGEPTVPWHEVIPSGYPSYDEIALRAYGIYEQEGFPEGQDVRHWLEAERSLQHESTYPPVLGEAK